MCIPTFANMLQPKLRYLDNVSSMLSLEVPREAYKMVAINLRKGRDRQPSKIVEEIPKFKAGDFVLLRNLKKTILRLQNTFVRSLIIDLLI